MAPPGGGGTQIWFRRGCAAGAAKPIPTFKGDFGGKGYLLLRVFSPENDVFVCFSDKMDENSQEKDVFVYFSDEIGENI